jgi:hypothetical protein
MTPEQKAKTAKALQSFRCEDKVTGLAACWTWQFQ